MAAITAAAVTTAIFLASALGQEIDSAIRAHNNKKARKLQKQLDSLTRKYNLQKSELDAELAKHNLKYDELMRNLEYTVPGGTAHTIMEKAIQNNRNVQKEYTAKQKQLDDQYSQVSNYLTQQVNEKQDRGLYDVLGGVING